MTEFDYIVVGAGTAGCVLANRLSADGRHSVLLLEAGGGDRNPIHTVPLLAGLAYWRERTNWGHVTIPQAGLDGREIKWPRGKLIGGSSSINGMMYMRGHRADYDAWAAAGLKGWSYAEVLPYFLRSQSAPERAGSPFHGTEGELRTTRARAENPLYAAFLEAGRNAGYPGNDDFNGPEQEGLGLYDFTIRDGRRESAATAFLRPARGRRNLEVWAHTTARRILIEEGRAAALEIDREGARQIVRARGEIVLAGGAVNSPQLLQLSGIGDGKALKAAGVAPLVEAPEVGRNLQDHLGVYLTYACREPVTLFSLFSPERAAMAVAQAVLFGTGPGTAVPLEAGGFLRTRSDLRIPDIHITFVPGLNLETTQNGQGRHGYLINFYQLRPESRGEIAIASPDARAMPRIDPRYLEAEADRACLRDGVRLARALGEQAPLSRYHAADISPVEADLESDASIDAWVRRSANTIFHPVGTCRMGSDKRAVVDGELRVRGVAGLRVADASVMPTIIGGNTAAPTMMIAEKAADMILGRPALPAVALPDAA